MKYYSNGVGEHIYDKQWWQSEAHILGKPVRVELQKREKGGDCLWCTHHIDFVCTSETCGKKCKHYLPRNGKSGCCRLATPGFVGTGEFYEINEKGQIREGEMKTVSMWSYESGAREINLHGVEPELFEKLRPAFDVKEGMPDWVGQINVDKNTTIIFFKKHDDGKDEKCQDL